MFENCQKNLENLENLEDLENLKNLWELTCRFRSILSSNLGLNSFESCYTEMHICGLALPRQNICEISYKKLYNILIRIEKASNYIMNA